MNAELEDIIKGSIVGLLIGDALGYPYSGKKVPPQKINFIIGPDGEEPGVYQGPSSLALCTMASINECRGIMPDDIVEKFNDFLIAGYLGASEDCSDLSEVTIAAIKNYNNGMPPDKCGIREKNDNECLVRMLPVALDCVCDPLEVIIEKVHQVCGITHAEIISKVTCTIFCLIVKTLISQKPEKVFDVLGDYYKTKKMDEYFRVLQNLKDWKNRDIIVRESASGKDVADCFWSAWAAYSKFETDFRLCVTSVISLGNDANSTGAVAGSLAGLANGLSNIPPEWLSTIVLSSEAMEVIQSFTDSTIGKINK